MPHAPSRVAEPESKLLSFCEDARAKHPGKVALHWKQSRQASHTAGRHGVPSSQTPPGVRDHAPTEIPVGQKTGTL